jgi:hypothetical protein
VTPYSCSASHALASDSNLFATCRGDSPPAEKNTMLLAGACGGLVRPRRSSPLQQHSAATLSSRCPSYSSTKSSISVQVVKT